MQHWLVITPSPMVRLGLFLTSWLLKADKVFKDADEALAFLRESKSIELE
jgi:hypothetical protein